MTKPTDRWMPLYIGEYLADTMHLSISEHGAYILLMMDYWIKGPPPDDDRVLATITKTSKVQWKKIRTNLVSFFSISDDGFWRHKRIDAELANARNISEVRSKAGASGANGKWHPDAKRMAKRMANARQTDGQEQKQDTNLDLIINNPSSAPAHEPAREDAPLTEPLDPAIDDGEGSVSFKKIRDPSGRSAPLSEEDLAEKKRNLLISKVTRFASAKLAEPEVALVGLMGADPEHDAQWWLDHLDDLMKTQRWDDTRMSA